MAEAKKKRRARGEYFDKQLARDIRIGKHKDKKAKSPTVKKRLADKWLRERYEGKA